VYQQRALDKFIVGAAQVEEVVDTANIIRNLAAAKQATTAVAKANHQDSTLETKEKTMVNQMIWASRVVSEWNEVCEKRQESCDFGK